MDYYTYVLLIVLLSILPQLWVNSVYRKYSQVRVGNGKSGEMVVNEMLFNSGISGISINRIGGHLSDHYDSKRKSINLSSDNFTNPTIASVAVAAHETGHAIQDNKGYFFLRLRHALGPATIVASKISWIFIYLGFLLFFEPLMWVGIICLAVVLLFNIVTLPVEINASSRARKYLISTGTYTSEEISGATKVLRAAAFTYIAVVLAGILQIIRLISNVRRD